MAACRAGILIVAALKLTSAVQLPSGAPHESCEKVGEGSSCSTEWWAKVHDKVFYPPPASMLELTQDISNYYYALGSPDALTDELKAHRVGGEGVYHIFHLPKGPSTIQLPSLADRRSSFSALVQLEQGTVLGEFPPYTPDSKYSNPLSQKGQELERQNIEKATPELFEDILKQITLIGSDGVSTRSWQNAEASHAATDFIQNKFLEFGLSSCLDKFEYQGKQQANVMAMIPGTSPQSLSLVAHYDSRPYEGAAPGAEDNGSGLATLLLNAKLAAQSGLKPVKQLLFAAVAAEEVGLVGSANLVSRLQAGYDVSKILGASGPPRKMGDCFPNTPSFLERERKQARRGFNQAIVLDEVGWASPKLKTHRINFETFDTEETKAMMDHLAQVNKQYNGEEMQMEHSNKPFGSDHMSFLDKEEPALLLINSDDSNYPFYHQSGDVLANVDKQYAAKVVKMTHGAMLRIAGVQEDTVDVQQPVKLHMAQEVGRSAEKGWVPAPPKRLSLKQAQLLERVLASRSAGAAAA